MSKTANTLMILAALAYLCSASVLAQVNKPAQKDTADAKPAITKPAEALGWVVIEEDWWYPLRNEFAFFAVGFQYRATAATMLARDRLI